MKTKTINKINGGIALWYGIGALLSAIGSVVGFGIFFYDYLTTDKPFMWWALAFWLALIIATGAIAYVLLRVGYEQMEE